MLEPASEIRMVCQTVRNWCDEMQDARRVWNAIIRRWGHRNATAARTAIPADRIRLQDGKLAATLKPFSWNMFRIKLK